MAEGKSQLTIHACSFLVYSAGISLFIPMLLVDEMRVSEDEVQPA